MLLNRVATSQKTGRKTKVSPTSDTELVIGWTDTALGPVGPLTANCHNTSIALQSQVSFYNNWHSSV